MLTGEIVFRGPSLALDPGSRSCALDMRSSGALVLSCLLLVKWGEDFAKGIS